MAIRTKRGGFRNEAWARIVDGDDGDDTVTVIENRHGRAFRCA